jgi:serine/threonine-protein kinase
MTGPSSDPRSSTGRGQRFENLGTRSGTILGRYELVRRIGAGGMAEVYEAVHRGLKKTVAVKVLLPETAANPDLVARFLREGEAASRIQHPHVVDVTDVGEDEGVAYLVMEYLEGQTLNELVNQSPNHRLSLPRTLDILLPIAAALDEAHRNGVVHRDLKPENVFIAKSAGGRAIPKILDFGVSKLTGTAIPTTTAVSSILGTPHYMSPEQARGDREVDGRADQYSFALMIFECITGTLPFRSDNVVALIHEVTRGVGTAPSDLVPELPMELDIVLLKALGADPEYRYASLAELGEKLFPFASVRAREAFTSLLGNAASDKEPRSAPFSVPPPPAEITGSFRPSQLGSATDHRPTPTIAQRPSARIGREDETPAHIDQATSRPAAMRSIDVPTSSPAPSMEMPSVAPARPSSSRLPIVMMALVALLLAGVGGFWLSTRSGVEPAVIPIARVEVIDTIEAAEEARSPDTEGATGIVTGDESPPPARLHVVVVVLPATASLELDGEPMGAGTFEHWVTVDGATHRVTAHAPGYVTQIIEFTDDAPPARITLVRDPGTRPRPHPSTETDRAPNPSDDEHPIRRDEDLRSTR